jgi:hypothetical protein
MDEYPGVFGDIFVIQSLWLLTARTYTDVFALIFGFQGQVTSMIEDEYIAVTALLSTF